ncbi:hypothetical protein pb186bvf_003197 [Paramecium bursaria]
MSENLPLVVEKKTQNLKIMIIGQQDAGKTLLIQRFLPSPGINKTIIIQNQEYDFQVIDTPAYDPFFTMLTMSSQNINGYVVVFSQHNLDVLNTLKDIRQKLFQISGIYKPMVVVANINPQLISNQSGVIEEENLIQIIRWCDEIGIKIFQMNLKSEKEDKINQIFEYLAQPEQKIPRNERFYLFIQELIALSILIFGMWYIFYDPSIIVYFDQSFSLKQQINYLSYYVYQQQVLKGYWEFTKVYFGIRESNHTYIQRSKILIVLDLALSVFTILITCLYVKAMSCIVISALSLVWGIITIFILNIITNNL